MQTVLPSRTSPRVGIRRASSPEPPRRLRPELGLEEEGEGLDRGLDPAPQAGQLGALGAGAAVLGERRPGGGARRSLLVLGERRQLLRLGLGEALGVEAVEVDAVDGDADLVAQVLLQRRRLVDRHLLRQGDDRGAGVLVVGDQAVQLQRLGVDRADPGDRGEGARRLQEADAVAGGRRVDDHQVVLAPRLDLAVELGQLPDLADRDQLLQARGGGGEVVEDAAAEEQVAHRPHLQLQQHVLAHRLVGVDRDRPEVLLHLDLVEADGGVVEHPRGVLLRGDLADDRPLSFRGGAQAERHRDRRLADATLAGDDDQPLVEEFGDRAIPSNFEGRQEKRPPIRISAQWDF